MTPQRPWSIQLEVVEGCNYSCWFCGIHSIRDPKHWGVFRNMKVSLVRQAFRELNKWLPKIRVEINNHGEPALHPKLTEIIEVIKSEMPTAQVQLQTNCSTIEASDAFNRTVSAWFAAGCNLLCLNAYKRWWDAPPTTESRYTWFAKLAHDYGARNTEIRVIDLYHENPDHVSMYHYHGPKVRYLMVLDDLGEMNTSTRTESGRPVSKDICNEAGNTPAKPLEKLLGRPVLTEPLQKKCTRPFRELILSWDGHIPVCCYDWSSQLVLGKFSERSLQEIWEAPETDAVRELLMRKNRHMAPCDVCDYNGGWRQGLLQPTGLTASDKELQRVVAALKIAYKKYSYPAKEVR